MAEQKNTAVAVNKEITNSVLTKVKAFESRGEIYFPTDYTPENALKSAQLVLAETVDRNKNSVLAVCTPTSIANALLSMVIQGLNPDKKQCYFIAYGTKLTLMRSYFGSIAVAKRVDETIEDIVSEVVYEGDVFEFEKKRGKTIITKHEQKLENMNKTKIVAAYCNVLYLDGGENATIMTFADIKQSWKQSVMNPVDAKGNITSNSVHDKFTEEMCKRTVTNKACKPIINSSDDRNLVARFAKESDEENAVISAQAEVDENANGEFLETPFVEVGKDKVDTGTGEIMSDEEKAEIIKQETHDAGF